jgi:hypothetical protein
MDETKVCYCNGGEISPQCDIHGHHAAEVSVISDEFADYWGINPNLANEVYGHMWDDYTFERLPILRQRWSENMALCESKEDRKALKKTMGYAMWQVLELLATIEHFRSKQ